MEAVRKFAVHIISLMVTDNSLLERDMWNLASGKMINTPIVCEQKFYVNSYKYGDDEDSYCQKVVILRKNLRLSKVTNCLLIYL
jgi:hypothetical protein